MAANSNNKPNTQGKKQMSAKARAKKKRKRIILFVVEIFILLIMVVVLYGVIKTEKVQRYAINEGDLEFNENVDNNQTLKGYRNIALFGVDATKDGSLGKGNRTDSIMIASINEETKEVKIVSVYRDTFLNRGNDSYNKANTAYANGGPEAAISMLNMNLDLNVTDFITVGYAGLIDTINELGGVMIEVDEAELEHINNYQYTIGKDFGRDYVPVKETGYQLLDGMQATAYCRIRYTAGNDFKRTERQREVLMAIAEKVKGEGGSAINGIANKVFPQVMTSLELDEILGLLKDVASYKITDNSGFPFTLKTGIIGKKGSCVVPADLDSNVIQLHEFLFNEKDYVLSEDAQKYSDEVKSQTSQYVGSKKAETP